MYSPSHHRRVHKLQGYHSAHSLALAIPRIPIINPIPTPFHPSNLTTHNSQHPSRMSPGRLLARTLHIQKHISTPSSTLPNAAPKPRTMATDAGASPTAAPRKLKILMLHGTSPLHLTYLHPN